MATVAQTKLLTAEEFMAAELGEGSFELVRGEVVEVPPPMPDHGCVVANVVFVLASFGRQSRYGYCLTESALVTERGPDTVRGADVSFYSEARWPRSEVRHELPPVPPDLAVEVYSPGNRPGAMGKKVAEYLIAGVALVWVIYPAHRTVVIHRNDDQPPVVLLDDAIIENLPELPGFRCRISDFFV